MEDRFVRARVRGRSWVCWERGRVSLHLDSYSSCGEQGPTYNILASLFRRSRKKPICTLNTINEVTRAVRKATKLIPLEPWPLPIVSVELVVVAAAAAVVVLAAVAATVVELIVSRYRHGISAQHAFGVCSGSGSIEILKRLRLGYQFRLSGSRTTCLRVGRYKRKKDNENIVFVVISLLSWM